jgi:hypothetical protein
MNIFISYLFKLLPLRRNFKEVFIFVPAISACPLAHPDDLKVYLSGKFISHIK